MMADSRSYGPPTETLRRWFGVLEAAGRAAFGFMVRLAELIVLTVFFSVAAAITGDFLLNLFAGLLMASIGLYVGVSFATIPGKVFAPSGASPLQAAMVFGLFLFAGAAGLFLTNTITSVVVAIAESQSK